MRSVFNYILFHFLFIPVISMGQLANPIQLPVINPVDYRVYISVNGNDSNAGDSLNPVATFVGALNTLNTLTNGLTGDVYTEVVLFSGTYLFALEQPVNRYNIGNKKMNVSVRGKGDVRLDGNGLSLSGGSGMVSLLGSHISVRNLKVLYSPSNGVRFGFTYNGTDINPSDILIDSVDVAQTAGHGIIVGVGPMSTVNSATLIPKAERFLISNCSVHDAVNYNTPQNQWGSSIKFLNVKHGTAVNNVVHDNSGEGVDINFCEYIEVKDNVIYDNYANVYFDMAENCILKNNLIYNMVKDKIGILFSVEPFTSTISDFYDRNLFIYNNVILNTTGGFGLWSGSAGGLQNVHFDNINFLNNTVIGKQVKQNLGLINFSYSTSFGNPSPNILFSNLKIARNIFSANKDSLFNGQLNRGPLNPQQGLVVEYNLYNMNPTSFYNSAKDKIDTLLPVYVSHLNLQSLVPHGDNNKHFVMKAPNQIPFADDYFHRVRFQDSTNVGAFELDVNPPIPPVITSNGSLTICQGDSVTLTCSSANSYLWSTAETTQSIVVKTSGSYTVSIDGGNVSVPTIVTVNALPPTPIISTNSDTLISSSSAGNQWFLDNAQISNANQQTYIATQNGDYSVKVTNTNTCSAISAPYSFTITTITQVPVITSNGSLTICQGDSVILTSSVATSYLWSTNETSQSITIKAGGKYAVSVTDSLANTSVSDTTVVIVNALPLIPTISVNEDTLISSATTGNQWFVGGSQLSNANQQNYVATQSGDYSVKVTNSNLCSIISAPFSYTVNINTPIPVITPGGSLTICQGDSAILTCSTANSYLWSTTETTQSITVKTSGSYTVSINGGDGVSVPTTVIVNALPNVGLTVAPSATVCAGSNITLTGTGALTYVWSDGKIDKQAFTITSDKTFTVTGTDANNCSNTATQSITIKTLPTVNSVANPSSAAICDGKSITLSGAGNAISYTWSGPMTITDGEPFTPTAIGNSTFTVTGIGQNNCTNTSTRVISVSPLPTVGVSITPAIGTVCLGESVTLKGTGATTYFWSDGITDGHPFIATIAGTKTYIVTGNVNSCTSTTTKVIHVGTCTVTTVGLGVQETTINNSILIIPNPNSGVFRIETRGLQVSKMKIYNLLGEIIYESITINSEIDLSSQPKGTYVIELQSSDKIYHKKLLIQ